MRLRCATKNRTIDCMPGDAIDLTDLCADCKATAIEHGVLHLNAGSTKETVFRASRAAPACSCNDKRALAAPEPNEPPAEPSAEERAEREREDAEVAGWIATIANALPFMNHEQLMGVDKTTLKEWAAQIEAGNVKTASAAKTPRPYSRALATRGDVEAEVRQIDKEIKIEAGSFPYSRALARQQTVEEIRAGAPLPKDMPSYGPARPPKPYSRALGRVAA